MTIDQGGMNMSVLSIKKHCTFSICGKMQGGPLMGIYSVI
jgi:hypothetical protein